MHSLIEVSSPGPQFSEHIDHKLQLDQSPQSPSLQSCEKHFFATHEVMKSCVVFVANAHVDIPAYTNIMHECSKTFFFLLDLV